MPQVAYRRRVGYQLQQRRQGDDRDLGDHFATGDECRGASDGKVVVHATFSDPGVYTLRARADDVALLGDDEVTVTVTK